MNTDYYKILDVPAGADAATIKHAYHASAKRAHPDAGGSHEQMERINRAYHTLSDPEARRRYDQERSVPAREEAHAHEQEHAHAGRQHEHHTAADPATQARAREEFTKLRRSQARAVALQLLLRSFVAAVGVGLVVRFVEAVAPAPGTRFVLGVIGFVPVYFVALAFAFLFDPDLRLQLFDLAHDRGWRPKIQLLRLLAVLALPFAPLALLWAWLLPL